MPVKIIESMDKATEKQNEMIWGSLPKKPLHLSVTPISANRSFLSGRATLKKLIMEIDFGNEMGEIPLIAVFPNVVSPRPAVVIINDEKGIDNLSIEQLVDNGYAVFSLYYKDITDNNSNFKSGLFPQIAGSRRKKTSSGKAIVWAWAAIRALEYASDLDEIDGKRIGVFGRGVFALSASLAANADSRFGLVMSNELPEINDDFIASHPYLFCRGFTK